MNSAVDLPVSPRNVLRSLPNGVGDVGQTPPLGPAHVEFRETRKDGSKRHVIQTTSGSPSVDSVNPLTLDSLFELVCLYK